MIPNVSVSIGSLFGYPAVCYAIGISAERSLAFAARSLTLALATPAVENLKGDVNTIAALAIMSGILGALIGTQMLDWMRIPEGQSSDSFFIVIVRVGLLGVWWSSDTNDLGLCQHQA